MTQLTLSEIVGRVRNIQDWLRYHNFDEVQDDLTEAVDQLITGGIGINTETSVDKEGKVWCSVHLHGLSRDKSDERVFGHPFPKLSCMFIHSDDDNCACVNLPIILCTTHAKKHMELLDSQQDERTILNYNQPLQIVTDMFNDECMLCKPEEKHAYKKVMFASAARALDRKKGN